MTKKVSYLNQSPCEIDIHDTANGYSAPPAGKAYYYKTLSTSPVWLRGSMGSKTQSDRRTYRAQDLGFERCTPTKDESSKKTMGSTQKSMSARLTNYTAVMAPSSQPGETKKALSCVS